MLEEIKDPEIFIGIVGAVGTDLNLVTRIIQEELRVVKYNSEEIILSKAITGIRKYKHLKDFDGGEKKRIEVFMDAGDEIREKLKLPAAMAYLGVVVLREIRTQLNEGLDSEVEKEAIPVSKQAYIFNSLKRPEEIKHLKRIYGNQFFVFSIFSPIEDRTLKLAEKICRSLHDSDPTRYEADARELIERDDISGHKYYGQDVQEAFPLGDLFVRMGDESEIRKQIHRFFEILFGHPFKTPTIDEYGMYLAAAVSKRSADLSRQVGAAILSKDGEILAVGCNDVPKFGGGISWDGEENDYRDFKIGHDPNVNTRDALLKEMFEKLEKVGWLSKDIMKSPLQLTQDALIGDEAPLKGTRVASLLEFGRVVHAEMNALMTACRVGVSVKGATLYCTTFPCHMCARHIISAGIEKVVFIEPYPKSMTGDLYSQMVSIDPKMPEPDKVSFKSFKGVSPTKFISLFERNKRKHDDGYAHLWGEIERCPRVNVFREDYIDSEAVTVSQFAKDATEVFEQSTDS